MLKNENKKDLKKDPEEEESQKIEFEIQIPVVLLEFFGIGTQERNFKLYTPVIILFLLVVFITIAFFKFF